MIATYVSIALLTGARRSAISAMRWADLDLRPGRGAWAVPVQWSKNGTELVVALTDRAVGVLDAWRDDCPSGPWVFPSADSATGHLMEPKKAWADSAPQPAFPTSPCTTCAGRLGLRDRRRRRQRGDHRAALGHVSSASARSYIHLNVDEARRALEGVER